MAHQNYFCFFFFVKTTKTVQTHSIHRNCNLWVIFSSKTESTQHMHVSVYRKDLKSNSVACRTYLFCLYDINDHYFRCQTMNVQIFDIYANMALAQYHGIRKKQAFCSIVGVFDRQTLAQTLFKKHQIQIIILINKKYERIMWCEEENN